MRYKAKPEARPVNIEQRLYEMLNDIYPDVEIAGLTFLPGDIVKQLEPVGFRMMVRDEECFLIDEGYIEINGSLYHPDDVENCVINLNKKEL